MDLSTNYLGLRLPHPLMSGASPLVDELDTVKRLEDAGSSAIVMHSLFEEQIAQEQNGYTRDVEQSSESSAEALSFFPQAEDFKLGPDQYLEQIQKIKKSVKIPLIASLNGVTDRGWLDYAKQIQQAGADALELNVYQLATDFGQNADAIERRLVNIARIVKHNVKIPVAVKLSPFYTSVASVAKQLDELKIDGMVLFNRFYQPDIDLENLEVEPNLHLSDSSELLLRLRWTAILSGRVKASLAVSGGVHTAEDAIKAVMTGAHAVQVVSVLLKRGPQYIRELKKNMERWMEEHEYESVKQMQGSMNLQKCPDPAAFERANYMRVLHSWR